MGFNVENEYRKLAAIVFTDIVGYTQTMDKDEARARDMLKRQREIIFPLVQDHDGEVLKEMGDGMLLMFSSVLQAVQCAIEIQKEEKDFALRIGIHIGEVVVENGDVFGSGVNIASRIEQLASPGEIFVSSAVWHQVQNQTDLSSRPLGPKKLKGVANTVEVYQLILQGTAAPEPQPDAQVVHKERPVQTGDSPDSGGTNLKSIFKEFKRRNVYKVGVAYGITGWIIIQIATTVFPALQFPPWTTQFIIILVMIGLPISLVLAWAFEITPQGIKRTQQAYLSGPGTSGQEKEAILQRLINRRVPQVTAVYIFFGWLIVQLISWIVNNYLLSPHLVSFSIMILICFSPTVLLFTYFHGRSEFRWSKTEKFGIPINILVALPLLYFNFQGKDLGSAVTTMTVEDENGSKIERVLPKSEFRKKVVLYFLDNRTGIDSLDWVQYGIPLALDYDLAQDPFVSGLTGYYFHYKIEEAGFDLESDLPLTLEQKWAREAHQDYFISGELLPASDSTAGNFEITLYVHDAQTGNRISSHSQKTGDDLFSTVDDLSVKIKQDIGIPKGHLEKVKDMPVSEIFTHSTSAFQQYVEGINDVIGQNDYASAVPKLEAAIALDETFVQALYELQMVYLSVNQQEKRLPVFEKIIKHIYKVPERMQYLYRADYYWLRQEADNTFAVINMLVKLYPNDIKGRRVLAYHLELRNRVDEAIEQFKAILQIDPTDYQVLRTIGSLYEKQGNFEDARSYYQRYADHFPEDYRSFLSIGELSELMGDFEDARTNYKQALLLQPGRVSLLQRTARIEYKAGNFEQAHQAYTEALKRSSTPQERTLVYQGFDQLAILQGRIKDSFMYLDSVLTEAASYTPPVFIKLMEVDAIERFLLVGEPEKSFNKIESLAAQLTPPFNELITSMGNVYIYTELDDPDKLEQTLPVLDEFFQKFQMDAFKFMVHYGRGRVAELRGDFDDAIVNYKLAMESLPKGADSLTEEIDYTIALARCYRKTGKYDEAEELLQRTLNIFPAYPKTHVELAELALLRKDNVQASNYLDSALSIWDHADSNYIHALKAREMAGNLQNAL